MSTAAIHLNQLLEPFANCFSAEGAARIADLRADLDVQERVDYLADQANDGLLTDEEREEYEGYLHAIDVIAILQAKARSQLRGQS